MSLLVCELGGWGFWVVVHLVVWVGFRGWLPWVVLAVCLIYVNLVLGVFGWLLLACGRVCWCSVVCLRVRGGWCVWCYEVFALDVWVWGMWWVFGCVSGIDGILGWFALFWCVDELVVCVGLGGYFRYEFAAGVRVC